MLLEQKLTKYWVKNEFPLYWVRAGVSPVIECHSLQLLDILYPCFRLTYIYEMAELTHQYVSQPCRGLVSSWQFDFWFVGGGMHLEVAGYYP